MKEPQYYILRRFALLFLCIISMHFPIRLCAQDNEDSIIVNPDTTISTLAESKGRNQKYSEPVLRAVPDTTVERMKGDKAFAYANDPAYWAKERKIYRKGFWDYVFEFFSSDLVRVIFYVVIGALILFVLYRIIVVNDLLIFYSAKGKRLHAKDPELAEIDPVAIDKKIQEAIDQRNYNHAVRYLYLKTLYTLNDKKWIQFHSDATDNEYLNQMSQHKRNREFQFLTEVYEYVWYGKFEINEQQFALVHNNFKSFQADI